MHKLLPFNFNIGNSTDCWNSKFLGIVLSSNDYFPWYVEKFINIYLTKTSNTYSTSYYNWGSNAFNSVYDEVLEFTNIQDKTNILYSVKEAINSTHYIYLDIDYYYVPFSHAHMKEHITHDCLVMGYNEDTQEIYYTDFNINGSLFSLNKMNFDNLSEAFYSAQNINKGAYTACILGMPASIIRLKEPVTRKANLSKIFWEFLNYSNGEIKHIKSINLKKYNNLSTSTWEDQFIEWHGISLYKGYYEDLYYELLNNKKHMNDDELISFKRLIENKQALLFRLEYLSSNNYLVLDNNLKNEINKLIDTISIARNLIIKFNFKFSDNALNKAMEYIIEAEKIDTSITAKTIDLLYDLIKT